MARSALLNVMVEAVRKAGRSLTRDFGELENLQVSVKGPGEFVTSADRRAGQILRDELARVRPGYGFLSAEGGAVEGSDGQHRWIFDPLDGTVNFMHGIPLFAISLALERQGVITAAVVYNPAMDELYVAERGGGAFCNDRRLRVAGRRNLIDAMIGASIPTVGQGDHRGFLAEQKLVMNETAGMRSLGCTALDLCWVASGRLDGFWQRHLHAAELAAGLLIIREAGGYASDLDGRDKMLESGTVLVGNEDIQRKLAALLAKAGD